MWLRTGLELNINIYTYFWNLAISCLNFWIFLFSILVLEWLSEILFMKFYLKYIITQGMTTIHSLFLFFSVLHHYLYFCCFFFLKTTKTEEVFWKFFHAVFTSKETILLMRDFYVFCIFNLSLSYNIVLTLFVNHYANSSLFRCLN